MRTILLTCGETSGEQHAARLVGAIKAIDPSCRVMALGGVALADAGAEIIYPLDRFAVMGFAEVLAKLPRIVALERSLGRLLAREGIDLFIPVDYPGLNLRLSRRAKAAGVPVFYFISPQIWHPLLDEIETPDCPKEAPAPGAPFTVILFPGSRRQVFERMFPVFCDAARRIRGRFGSAEFVVGLAPLMGDRAAIVPPDMRAFLRTTREGIGELEKAALALAASGTVTLQCALSGTPAIVSYRTSPISYAIGKSLVKIPWIAMPNVLARRRIVPELIQSEGTPDRIAEEAGSILGDPGRYRAMSADLISLRRTLEGQGGIRRIAEMALRMAEGESAASIAGSSGEGS
jgi:lipid-A-disaccharide synthase